LVALDVGAKRAPVAAVGDFSHGAAANYELAGKARGLAFELPIFEVEYAGPELIGLRKGDR
jgi:hypothetical protein